jgi:hypothetical protein
MINGNGGNGNQQRISTLYPLLIYRENIYIDESGNTLIHSAGIR